MLQVRDLAVEVGGRLTLTDASFALRAGDKVGLVGRNGAGKTSMMKVIAGEMPAAGGVVLRPPGLGYLPQDPPPRGVGLDGTALAHVLSGRGLDAAARRLAELHERVAQDPTPKNLRAYGNAEDAFRNDGGYAAEAEVRRITAGLGLGNDRLDLPIGALSGGERRRAELARILFAGSDVLLLDEPTNHLDVDAKAWLMTFLRSFRGALLVISHDLALLDQAITRVLHLDEGELIAYRGTYSQYLTARAADEERRARVATRQDREISRLRTLADSMRHQTEKRARVAKTLDHRVDKLMSERVQAAKKQRTLRVKLPDPPRAGVIALEAHDLAKAFGSKTVFEDVTFDVGRGERLLVLGLNGAGKTTLLRTIVGELEADLGEVRLGHNASLAYYAQEHEHIVRGRTVLEHVREHSGLADQYLRGLLGMFGLRGDIVFQDAATLSGGEKTKLALAMLVTGPHNVLLLDEPTNNL
ncbi:MAG TPA: ABC-F family ATP-binding cassette domain-containing protein, partial [Acidimicrobiia bacterium]|nr:ABC-F family ATP-binding cassette domain-containing protein [Acidimicrobiia bacterium]